MLHFRNLFFVISVKQVKRACIHVINFRFSFFLTFLFVTKIHFEQWQVLNFVIFFILFSLFLSFANNTLEKYYKIVWTRCLYVEVFVNRHSGRRFRITFLTTFFILFFHTFYNLFNLLLVLFEKNLFGIIVQNPDNRQLK